MASKTYIQLGRAGDILTVLPLLYADAQRGEKQALMVAKEFANILDGVSYVDPVVFEGRDFEIGQAVLAAEKLGRPWVCTQVQGPREACEMFVWGPANMKSGMTPSFQQEAYRACGRLKEWNDDLPLVFDRRNKEREQQLLDKVFPPKRGKAKKVILVAAEGVSSPFPYKKLLFGLLELAFPNFNIIDIGKMRLDYFHDLLALYERAHCLVAIDSGPLHLARAIPTLPVMALTADKPHLWNGSAWQPQHVFYCRYSDFPDRAMDMVYTIKKATPVTLLDGIVMKDVYSPAFGRNSMNSLNDEKCFPYVKDVIKMGMRQVVDDGLVCLSRATEIEGLNSLPCYAYRIERNGTGDNFIPVIDMVSAPKAFWKEHMKEIPDLLMGTDHYWGNVLWAMFRKYGAMDVTGCCWREAKNG